ncbi:MAG TPA: 4-hydroxythreonine-4-phosphate dehydrogenase PdxA [Flavobacteriales bacterium]|nr:4-hydroxythreonine-4-phosphate dehydrogenase PdxA [Flavobacteriales bacterium]HIN39646.1 4-hydroxythreonine-4-phosphate dehydrogenase PdxA [Flavobacteriales bacterium]
MGNQKPLAGISIGDINGVGPEVILKTFSDLNLFDDCVPIVYGSAQILKTHQKRLTIPSIELNVIKDESEVQEGILNVLELDLAVPELSIGQDTPEGGSFALASFEAAVDSLAKGSIDILITSPLNKHNVRLPGFKGHTGYLADKFGADNSLMIMSSDELKVALVTGHVPLRQVASLISQELILKKLHIFNSALIDDYGIANPKIAVLGLNPHAGDGGLIGDEEIQSISKAIKIAKDQGIHANGPISADGFFGSKSYRYYDGVLAMYHDQGLIPFKVIAFENGVNFTAGLHVVRTSPAHGVAYDIAGKNKASSSSFNKALILACDILSRRREQLVSSDKY